jgi:hypothetical protein
MRYRPIRALGVLVGLILVSITPGGALTGRCMGSAYRQFDFWLGSWDVTGPDGSVAGSNLVEKASDGCALVERWTGSRGGRGTSLNFYESATRQWHQIWVDNDGGVLELSGGLVGGKMVLSGTTPGDRTSRQRITWTPMDGGRVRQHWESSGDGGRTWKTIFDGTYSRRGSDPMMM